VQRSQRQYGRCRLAVGVLVRTHLASHATSLPGLPPRRLPSATSEDYSGHERFVLLLLLAGEGRGEGGRCWAVALPLTPAELGNDDAYCRASPPISDRRCTKSIPTLSIELHPFTDRWGFQYNTCLMNAPGRFAAWLSSNAHRDRRFGHLYRYHPRSDVHSVMLSTYILEDLLERCPILREQASRGEVSYGINVRHIWPTTQKSKTLDLAVGRPTSPIALSKIVRVNKFLDVFLACEAKSVMTEHGKSQPRVYDELSSSHEIVHQGRPNATDFSDTWFWRVFMHISDRYPMKVLHTQRLMNTHPAF
jgi:hypothetical protein